VRRTMRALTIYLTLALLQPLLGLRAAQRDDSLLPDQSEAKSRAIFQQVISALGGRKYLDARDSDCMGRLAQLDRNGGVMGYTEFRDQWVLPDKDRLEYIIEGHHNIAAMLAGIEGPYMVNGGITATVFNGNQGWVLDKGGVSDQPEDAVKAFNEQLKTGLNNLLRYRLSEPGLILRYAGPDILDLKEADWIEISDRDHRNMRIAVDHYTHLPLRWVVTTQDPDTKDRDETSTMYSQFTAFDGVMTATRISRSVNGREVAQISYSSCSYNANLSTDLFTRDSLEQEKKQAGVKSKK
jgi:hypothetical protein